MLAQAAILIIVCEEPLTGEVEPLLAAWLWVLLRHSALLEKQMNSVSF